MQQLQQLPRHTDVLIVGAGPAGLTLAVTLAQLGVSHVIIDTKPAAAPGSKAAAIQPRTLEYLDRIGVAETLIDDGLRGGGFAVVDRDRPLMRMSYDSVASPYPFLLLIGQQQTEIRLAERLEALGGRVHRSASLLDLHDDFPGTAATIVDADGLVHAVTARYVAGCDGVHSTVRQLAGIDFPGDAPPAQFALADIVVGDDSPADLDTTFSLSPHGMLITSPLPGNQVRVVAGVPDGTPAPDAAAIADLLNSRGGGWIRKASVESVAASSAYRVQQRVAATLRRGNVFLLGDAAHTHSPAGGQGMNTGIQDAANLGWKLHHVLTGRAPAELLDSYDAERRPVAAHLIAFTSQLMQIATITQPPSAELRNNALHAVADVPGVTDYLATRLAQLDIGYPVSNGDDALTGTRIDPRVSRSRGLAWTLVTPPDADVAPADGEVTVTVTSDVDRPVAVRPDGIAADSALFTTLFGIDL
ncbi:MAG TPA: FAD-dependent monooxygenase [Mycobacterium sp.]|nr:FAD-dependent monooxygenase [Mycobacterium sp.]